MLLGLDNCRKTLRRLVNIMAEAFEPAIHRKRPPVPLNGSFNPKLSLPVGILINDVHYTYTGNIPYHDATDDIIWR